jgi:hypothetical protein
MSFKRATVQAGGAAGAAGAGMKHNNVLASLKATTIVQEGKKAILPAGTFLREGTIFHHFSLFFREETYAAFVCMYGHMHT